MQTAYISEDYIEIAKKWRIFKQRKESKYKIEEKIQIIQKKLIFRGITDFNTK